MDRQYITVKLQRALNQKLQAEAQFKQLFYINPDNLQWPSEYSACKTQALENRAKFVKQILRRNPDLRQNHIALTHMVIKSRLNGFNVIDVRLNMPTNLDSPDEFFSKGLHLSVSANLRTALDTFSTMNSSYHEAFFNYKHQVVTLKYLVENAYNKIDNAQEQLKTYAEFKQVLDEYMKTLDIQKSALDISHDRYLDLVKNIHEYEEQIISNKSALFKAYFDLILMANMLLPSKVSPILKA